MLTTVDLLSCAASAFAPCWGLESEYLVFSVGRNDYGHPASSALSLAWLSGGEVLRTDKLGHIALGHDQELRYRYSGKLTA